MAPRTFSPSRLRQARIDVGLSRTQLAAKIGRAYCQVSGYEQGRYRPGVEVLGTLADVLGVPIDDLFAVPEAEVAA